MRIAVVGAGLIGAAAARHLALMGHQVVLIGPGEPENKRTHQGVFASHYDEGRITRSLATSRFWAEVSRAAIGRYGDIAAHGAFFAEVGAIMAAPGGAAFTQK
ncbi:MAG: FAD-dependent oxidoreductase, partial [Pseudomonadota bacterium]